VIWMDISIIRVKTCRVWHKRLNYNNMYPYQPLLLSRFQLISVFYFIFELNSRRYNQHFFLKTFPLYYADFPILLCLTAYVNNMYLGTWKFYIIIVILSFYPSTISLTLDLSRASKAFFFFQNTYCAFI